MNKSHQKKQKAGYRLSINRTSVPGDRNWEVVGFLFKTRYEASTFKEQKYPGIKKYKIEGVRLDVSTVSYVRGNDASRQ